MKVFILLTLLKLATIKGENYLSTRKCIDLDNEFQVMLTAAKQIFIIMPANAAGTSLNQFNSKCTSEMNNENSTTNEDEGDDANNYVDLIRINNVINFHSSLEMILKDQEPKLVTSHLYSSAPLIDLIKFPAPDTLLIYLHRNETDRISSAINHVVESQICLFKRKYERLVVQNNLGGCILSEKSLINEVIYKELREISWSTPRLLTCSTFEAIKQNSPNIIFMNYKQASRLQRELAKEFCPKIEPIVANTHESKIIHPSIELEDGTLESLNNWIGMNSALLNDWMLKRNGPCQSETDDLENFLLTCKDGAMFESYYEY